MIKAAQRFDETRVQVYFPCSMVDQAGDTSVTRRTGQDSEAACKQDWLINRINKAYSKLEQEYEREPSAQEIADLLEIAPEDVKEAIRTNGRTLSMDAPISSEEDNNMYDVMQNEDTPSPDRNLINESLSYEIEKALNTLSPREARVLKLYFGIGMKHPFTLEEIGEELKLTRERVRQIKEKAIKRIQFTTRCRILKSYLG
ncbi:MAG: sigma-70 family RNA polymerase sigma factor [Bacteroidales bacterium]